MQVLTATAQSGFFEVELDEEHARAINARRHTHSKLSPSLSLLDRRHAVFNSPSARAKHTGSKRDPDLVHHPDEDDVQAWFGAQSHYRWIPQDSSIRQSDLAQGYFEFLRLETGFELSCSSLIDSCYRPIPNRSGLILMGWTHIDLGAQDPSGI
jgi:hypothetical protein